MPVSGPFKLSAIERPICPGMQVQLHLYDKDLKEVEDFSEFTFEPIPSGQGEISPDGLYTAPDILPGNTSVEIKLKWKPNQKIETRFNLALTPNSESNLISKIPHQVQFRNRLFHISESNKFLFATMITGEGPSKNQQFHFYLVDINGQALWSRGFGVIGQTNFGMFYRDNIFVSGWAQMGNNGESISIIYDLEGNALKKEIQDEMYFSNFYVNPLGELYLANSSHPHYANPTEVVKLSSGFDILERNSLDYPVHSFVANEDGSIVAYYFDEIKKENGVVMVDRQGQEKWKTSLPYQWFLHEAKLVAINDQRFGLVKEECKVIPCGIEMMYYEFGGNGELINPGHNIFGSTPTDLVENSPIDDQDKFHMLLDSKYGNGLVASYIRDVFVLDNEVLVVFNVRSKNYQGIMIKGTNGSSLEYWWDPTIASQTPLKHISMINKNGSLE